MPRKSAREPATRTASGRSTTGADGVVKARTLRRLRRIEGQVRGLQRMVDDERRCTDVLTQIASVHEALRAVGRELVRGHLMQCATPAAGRSRNADAALYDEFLDLMYRHLR